MLWFHYSWKGICLAQPIPVLSDLPLAHRIWPLQLWLPTSGHEDWVRERYLSPEEPTILSPGTVKECKSASVGQRHVNWLLEWGRGSYVTCSLEPMTEMEKANLQREKESVGIRYSVQIIGSYERGGTSETERFAEASVPSGLQSRR